MSKPDSETALDSHAMAHWVSLALAPSTSGFVPMHMHGVRTAAVAGWGNNRGIRPCLSVFCAQTMIVSLSTVV